MMTRTAHAVLAKLAAGVDGPIEAFPFLDGPRAAAASLDARANLRPDSGLAAWSRTTDGGRRLDPHHSCGFCHTDGPSRARMGGMEMTGRLGRQHALREAFGVGRASHPEYGGRPDADMAADIARHHEDHAFNTRNAGRR